MLEERFQRFDLGVDSRCLDCGVDEGEQASKKHDLSEAAPVEEGRLGVAGQPSQHLSVGEEASDRELDDVTEGSLFLQHEERR